MNPLKPIYSLEHLMSVDDEPNPYPFDNDIGKLEQYPASIDILHLIQDINSLNPLNVVDQYLLEKIKIQIGNSKISFIVDLLQFVKYAVRKVIDSFCYESFISLHPQELHGPNWMLILYHHKLNKAQQQTNIHQILNLISPMLSLFDVKSFYDSTNDNCITQLISALIIIRENVPFSQIKGIDYEQMKQLDDNKDNDKCNNDQGIKYYVDYQQLFGEKLLPFLLSDLCKHIMTFLDIKSFFKCSMINHSWLNFIYRNDAFLSIYKQIIDEKKHLRCKLIDHSILSQVHVPTAPFTVGYTLKIQNNSYLDFITLKNHWFQEYVDIISLKLQQKVPKPKVGQPMIEMTSLSDDDIDDIDLNMVPATQQGHVSEISEKQEQIWIDIAERTKSSNEIGFDAIAMKEGFEFDPDSEYRITLQILRPFKSKIIYSNIKKLDPVQWNLTYNECKARDDDQERYDRENDNDDNNNDERHRKLFHVHKFWFRFYVELLQSLNTNITSDVLKNLRICQNRISEDTQFLKQQYTQNLFRILIRLIFHENNKISLNAMRCLRRIAIQDLDDMQTYFLQNLADHGLIKICESMLRKIREKQFDNNVSSLREQMLWFLGYFIKSGVKWKGIILKELDIHNFLDFTIEEIQLAREPKYTLVFVCIHFI